MKLQKYRFAVILALVTLVSCGKDDPYVPQEWQYDKYADTSVRPGDDFYRYVSGLGLGKAGDDAWAMLPRWMESSAEFVRAINSDDESNPVPEMRQLISLREKLADGKGMNDAIANMRERLSSIGTMTDISQFPGMLARTVQDGYMVLSVAADVLPGHKFGIIPQSMVLYPSSELPRDVVELAGIDYDEYLERYELASQAQAYFSSEIKVGTNLAGLDFSESDNCSALLSFWDRNGLSVTSKGGDSALDRFAAALGNANPDFKPLDDATVQFFSLLDRMDNSMLEMMNAYLWHNALSYDMEMILNPDSMALMFLTMQIPSLAINACRYYCENHVSADNMERNARMFENLRSAFLERIDHSDWMSSGTARYAREKLEAMEFHNGILPWEKYDASAVSATDFCTAVHVMRGEYVRKTIAMGADNTSMDNIISIVYSTPLFGMPAYSANSFYLPTSNAMCVLPSTSMLWDMNPEFPFILFITGHEMCHGFDSNGSHYDRTGSFSDWWAIDDKLQFQQKQRDMVNIFNQYYVAGETFSDGEKTLEENMADLGGLEIAYAASMKDLRGRYSGKALADKERLFFKSYAVSYAKYQSDSEKIGMVSSDVHSIYELRINGIVNHIDGWYGAFDVRRGDRLYLAPSRRVHLW